MYRAVPNSPIAHLTAPLTATSTVIEVDNSGDDVFPPAPNVATLGEWDGIIRETVRYTGKEPGMLTGVSRAIEEGEIPLDWENGTQISSLLTASVFNTMQENIEQIHEDAGNIKGVTNHAELENLDFAHSGHTGFASEAALAEKMPSAPTNAVHGAMGQTWVELEGVALQSVIAVNRGLEYVEEDGVFRILDWDKPSSIIIELGGAQITHHKGFSDTVMYSIGADSTVYRFTFDVDEHTVRVETMRISGTNPNLLHNADFTGANPVAALSTVVNQRGAATYTTSATLMYSIDRWMITAGATLTIIAGAIRLTRTGVSSATLLQRIEFPESYRGKTITASARMANVNVAQGVNISIRTQNQTIADPDIAIFDDGIVSLTAKVPDDATLLQISIDILSLGSVDVQAVKLEHGTTSTISADKPMKFSINLMNCQRFYEVIPGARLVIGFFNSGNMWSNTVAFNTRKRVVPVMTLAAMTAAIPGATHAAFSHNVLATVHGFNMATGAFTLPNMTAAMLAQLGMTTIEANADL